MRKGALGVENLNQILQKYLNPPAPDKAERENGGNILREGDKGVRIRNNYQMEWEIRGINGIVAERGMGVFNGDLGMIRSINPYTEVITVEFEEGKFADYTFKQADELELATPQRYGKRVPGGCDSAARRPAYADDAESSVYGRDESQKVRHHRRK